MKCKKCGCVEIEQYADGRDVCVDCGEFTNMDKKEDDEVVLVEEVKSRVGINRRIYPLDLAESYGFGPEFAAGTIIDLVSKFRKHDESYYLEKASWYLSRLICQMYGANAARKAMESFKEGIE